MHKVQQNKIKHRSDFQIANGTRYQASKDELWFSIVNILKKNYKNHIVSGQYLSAS